MNSRNVILTLLLILLLSGIFLCRRWQEPVRKEALNRSPDKLTYTTQASCLMKCLQVDEKELARIIRKGIILLNKSNRFNRPCPTFAVQGALAEGKSLQVLLLQCTNETTVLSCNLVNQNFECQCPGDGSKLN